MEFERSSYSSTITYKTEIPPEVIQAIQNNIDFPQRIKLEAMSIADRVIKEENRKILKGTRKFSVIFYSFYMAYYNLGEPVDPDWLAKKIGASKKAIREAFREYLPSGDFTVDPRKAIKFYLRFFLENVDTRMKETAFMSHIDDIFNTISQIPQGVIYLEDTEVKKVCIGIIDYIIQTFYDLADELPASKVAKAFNETPQNISAWRKSISKLYNEA